jgi:hypothetical protein
MNVGPVSTRRDTRGRATFPPLRPRDIHVGGIDSAGIFLELRGIHHPWWLVHAGLVWKCDGKATRREEVGWWPFRGTRPVDVLIYRPDYSV